LIIPGLRADCRVLHVAIVILSNYEGDTGAEVRAHHAVASGK
jgi:hypothetical protein